MPKQVLIVEDDAGYESLLRNLGEGRGWSIALGADIDEVGGSVDWADIAIVDLDAASGSEAVTYLRGRREDLAIIALAGDETATPSSTGADAVVHQLPGDLVNVVNRLTAPPANVIDLTASTKPGDDKPWYVTS
jgi:ActR/RegA family two-component response regulator